MRNDGDRCSLVHPGETATKQSDLANRVVLGNTSPSARRNACNFFAMRSVDLGVAEKADLPSFCRRIEIADAQTGGGRSGYLDGDGA